MKNWLGVQVLTNKSVLSIIWILMNKSLVFWLSGSLLRLQENHLKMNDLTHCEASCFSHNNEFKIQSQNRLRVWEIEECELIFSCGGGGLPHLEELSAYRESFNHK